MNDILQILRSASSALTAERLRLDVVANNIANVNSTRTPEGGPYRRRLVVLQPQSSNAPFEVPRPGIRGEGESVEGVSASIVVDNSTGPRTHEPSHPDADAEGYVQYPNVDVVTEMTNALSATRSYQANLSIIDAAKRMAEDALGIARG